MTYNWQHLEYSETEEKIFLAALKEFATYGRKGARMHNIAAKAGFNKALIHYYFRSKDRLYEEVLTFVITRFLTGLFSDLDTATDFSTMLRRLIVQYIELFEQRPLLPKFMLRELWEGAPVFQEKIRSLFPVGSKSPPALFIEKMNESITAGILRPVDPIQTLFTILGACSFFYTTFFVFAAILPEVEAERERLVQERANHVYDILMNGLASHRGNKP